MDVLKKKFYRDVHALTKRKGKSVPLNKMESNRIYTLVDGELDIAEEVKFKLNHIIVTNNTSYYSISMSIQRYNHNFRTTFYRKVRQ